MNRTNQLEKIGPLQTKFWGAEEKEATKIVVFHGYGASASDLYELGRAMDPQGTKGWYFPQGFLEVPIGPMMSGYAWFPIDQEEAQRAMLTQGGLKYAHLRPPGLDEAVEKGMLFLKEIGFDPQKDILGGFSQGSMMTVELQRTLAVALKRILVLSGSLVDEAGLSACANTFSGTRVFQSHGTYDDILPVAGATALKTQLERLGASVDFHEFRGGHEIPMPVLMACQAFISGD